MRAPEIAANHSPTAAPIACGADRPAHTVQFYSGDEYLIDQLSRLIGTTLGAGDAAILVTTREHREALLQRLAGCGFDSTAPVLQGRLTCLDAAENLAQIAGGNVLDASGFISLMGAEITRAHAAAGNRGRVVIFGEMAALLWARGKGGASLELEKLWNKLAGQYACALHCAYPMEGFCRPEHSMPFLQICGEHTSVIPVESYTNLSNEGDRLRLITQLQQKAQALESAMAEQIPVQQALQESQELLRKSREELEDRVRERSQELGQAESLLRKLSQALLSLRDEERRRIARELHDSTGQILAALQLTLASAQQDATLLAQSPSSKIAQELVEKLAEGMQFGEQALNEVRTMSYMLHPPMLDESGLRVALAWYVDGLAHRTGLNIDLHLPGDLERLPRDMELAIFRIVQEALSNVYRHSGSKTATIDLRREVEHVRLAIQDAGRFVANPPRTAYGEPEGAMIGVGIAGMRERVRQFGGEFDLTVSDSGTHLMVTFPLSPRARSGAHSHGDFPVN
jgi:signal transduction histidine kinase